MTLESREVSIQLVIALNFKLTSIVSINGLGKST